MLGMRDLRVVEPERRTAAEPPSDWAGAVVSEGHIVQTGYVAVHDVVIHAPRGHHLLPAEVERAYRRQLELGANQGWPPPTGYWDDDGRFVLTDGRNRYVAALMLGLDYFFVAWLVPPERCDRCHGTGFDGGGEPCPVCS
jgi:hypothetical protein